VTDRLPAPASLHHLSGPRAGGSDLLLSLPVRIGPDGDVDVPGAPFTLTLVRAAGEVVVDGPQPRPLRDGDVLELGDARLCYRVRRPSPGVRPLDLAFVVCLLAAGSFLAREQAASRREVERLQVTLREVERERSLFAARVEVERGRAASEQERLSRRIEELKQGEAALAEQLAAATSGEVQALRGDLQSARQRLSALETERATAERVIREYGTGVCLVQGAYAFFSAAGQPLRYRLDAQGERERNAEGTLVLDPDGEGAVHRIDYLGTGFLVDRRGTILTNRHVAEPWWNDDEARTLREAGFTARALYFRAFFPGQKEPLPLRVLRRSETVDLALVAAEVGKLKIPALPLARSGAAAVAGQPVVVIGYPTGLEALLAKTDTAVARQILEAHGPGSERVTEALARQGLIRPSATQGHIGDVTRSDIVFDAPTTEGGSGGPIFNRAGQVVAVEYAVLPRFGGNSFGVPIRYALELLAGKGGDGGV
jgi:S1-C subfamily serine protease